MKKGKGNLSILKRILVLTFIITLLSNYITIISEVTSIAFASEVEWKADFTSNLNALTKNLNQEENLVKNEEVISEQNDNSTDVEKIKEEELQQEEPKENEENATTDDSIQNIPENEALSEEEIEKIKQIQVNSGLEINKLLKFDNESGKGILADITIKINIDTKENEIENIIVDFDFPNISGVLPYLHKVNKLSDNIDFTNQEGSSKVLLDIKDIDEKADEEINMTLVYPEDAMAGNEMKVSGTVLMQISGYEVHGNFDETKEIEESAEQLANYKISLDNSSRYKGILYANTVLNNKKDFEYSSTDVIEIKDSNFIDEIIVENPIDKITTDKKEINLAGVESYKTTSIAVDEFKEILGEEGYIEVYTQQGEEIGEITTNTEVKNNNYVFYYDKDVDNVTFKICNIKQNGTLNIKNNKIIKGENLFSKEDIQSFKNIKTENINKIAKIIDENEVIISKINSENAISLEETETKVEMQMDTTSFSTQEENEVTFNVNLQSNSEQYSIFVNPTIDVIFPIATKNIEIESVNLLYRNGLILKHWDILQNEQGEKIIRISLDGVQEEYNPGTIIGNTSLNIVAKVTLDRLTTSSDGNIKLQYTNQLGIRNTYQVQGKEYEEYPIKYVSSSELISVLKFENFNNNNDVIETINTERNIGKIEVESTEKTSTVNMNIINNYKTTMEDVVIIGRLPVLGNSDNNENEFLSTFDANLKGAITTSGLIAKVYYSENINEKEDSNNWKEEISDYNSAKSFKIVIENKNINQGENIAFSYNLNIPANITYNQGAYGESTIYYTLNGERKNSNTIIGFETEKKDLTLQDFNNIQEIKAVQDENAEDEVEVENQNEGTEIPQNNDNSAEKAEIDSNTKGLLIGTQVTKGGSIVTEEDEINEKQILKYTTIIQNNTDQPINKIKIKGNAHNANMYWWHTYETISSTTGLPATTGEWIEDTKQEHEFDSIEIETLQPGESTKFEYQVVVNDLKELKDYNDKTVYGEIYISAEGIEENKIQTLKNNITDGDIYVSIVRSGEEDVTQMFLFDGDDYKLQVDVKNISDNDLKNVEVNVILPSILRYSGLTEVTHPEYNISLSKTATQNIITLTLDELKKGEEQTLYVVTMVDELDINVAEEETTVLVNVNANEREYISNDYIRTITQDETQYEIQFYGNKEDGATVSNGEKLTYNYVIKNIGVIENSAKISDFLPSGLKIDSIKIYKEDGTQDIIDSIDKDTNEQISSINYWITIKPGETVRLEIEATVDINMAQNGQKNIEHTIEFYLEEYRKTITYIIGYPEDWNVDQEPPKQNQEIDDPFIDDETNNNDDNNNDNNIIDEENSLIDESNTNNENKNDEDANIENKKENNNENIDNQNDNNSYEEEKIIELNNDNLVESISDDEESEESTNNISGIVWLDANKDGIMDSNEEKLSDINVKLFNKNNNQALQVVKTDKDGKYSLENIKKGSYIVLYEYDNELYSITKYRVDQATEITNSDVVSYSKIDEKYYGATDVIEVNNSNIENLNMGLINNNSFDLSIKTYISNVKVKTEKNTEEYTYDEDDFTRVEIASKEIEGAEVLATITIKVSNIGNTPGYVNQVKDTIPEGWNFDEKLNKNWSIGKDNSLYYSASKNDIIQPEKFTEIKLILTKEMTGNTTGTFKNTASIVSSTNKLELPDENKENDSASVDFIVTIKTGIVRYMLYMVIIMIIATSIFFIINKEKINGKNKRILLIFSISLLSIFIILLISNIVLAKGYMVDKLEALEYWGTGQTSASMTISHKNIDGYMKDFYGYGTRKQLLESKVRFRRLNYNVKTMMCLHGTTITSSADAEIKDINGQYNAVSAVDVGFDDGIINNFNRIVGDYDSKIFKGGEESEPVTKDFVADNVRVQTIAYMGYAMDNGLWDGISVPANDKNPSYRRYKWGMAYILKDASYRNLLAKVTGIQIVHASDNGLFVSHTDVDSASEAFGEFTNDNAEAFGIDKNKEISTDTIEVQKVGDNEYATLDGNFITDMKAIFPVGGRNKYLDNVVYIGYRTQGEDGDWDSWKRFKGKVYVKQADGSYKGYDQDATYGLNVKRNGKYVFNNADIAIKYNDLDLDNDNNELNIRILNRYYTYSGRFIYAYSQDVNQNQGVLRGKRNKKDGKSIVKWKVKRAGIKISKKVSKIDGEDVSADTTQYVEEGCNVVYNIKLTSIIGDLKDVTFSENAPAGLQYVSCSSGLTRNSDNTFTYTGTIPSTGSVNVKIKYKVIQKAEVGSNKSINNTVTVTKLKNEQGKWLYNPEKDINFLTKDSVLRASASVTMKQYSISISKTSDLSVAEYGDTIKFTITVKNDGSSPKYGKYKNIIISDPLPPEFVYVSHSNTDKWKKDGNNYIFSGTLDFDKSSKFVITATVVGIGVKSTNVATVAQMLNHEDANVTVSKSAQCTVKLLAYNASVHKFVYQYNDTNNNLALTDRNTYTEAKKAESPLQIEVGDTLTYKVVIGNEGANADDYGNIKDIYVTDTMDAGIELLQVQDLNGAAVSVASGNSWTTGSWTVTKLGNGQYQIYTSSTLSPGQSVTLYLHCQVTHRSLTNDILKNTADIIQVSNKNTVLPLDKVEGNHKSIEYLYYLTYHVQMTKYITSHTTASNNTQENLSSRINLNNTQKYDNPVEVEKYDSVTYIIEIKNTGVTKMNNITVYDNLEEGVAFSTQDNIQEAYVNGNRVNNVVITQKSANNQQRTYLYQGILYPNDKLEIKIQCNITKTNMYLLNLKNEFIITSVKNKNNVELITPTDILNRDRNDNVEWVRLKNLIISGKVWVDENLDGTMANNEQKLEGIEVRLHDDTNKKVAVTYTKADGSYIFGETNGDGNRSDKKMVEGGKNSGRVIKATNRNDTTGNYDNTSQYINYYLEFYYNGVKYESTVYAGNNGKANINTADNTYSQAYLTDSNAFEYSDDRTRLNNSLETIEYNTGIQGVNEAGTNKAELVYDKKVHESDLTLTNTTGISSYSFINKDKMHNGQIINGNNINMLFFSQTGETEYLKYINLGLQTRKIDLGLEKDVYDLKTTVNGTEMTYEYEKGKEGKFKGAYVTGGENSPQNYEFDTYISDWEYKHTGYKNQEVIDYKEHTELNTEVTYKITVSNINVEDKHGVYARVREIVDYYGTQFKPYDPANNTKTIKVIDPNTGYLVEKEINKVEAWYYPNGGNKVSLAISNTPKYTKHSQIDKEGKYNTLYITGFDNIALKQGESFDIYIKFVVDTEDGTEATNLKLGEKPNVGEINAYSTYYETDNRPAGFVDKNSNPGNLGLRVDGNNKRGVENTKISDYANYENDGYRTGIDIELNSDPSTPNPPNPENKEKNTFERKLDGTIWDDSRSEEKNANNEGTQYTGNGKDTRDWQDKDNKQPNAKMNEKLKENKNLTEEKDIPAEGIKADLIEVIKLPKDGKERIYEENLKTWNEAIVSTRSDKNGNYTFSSFIPGNYIVRFTYGESKEDVVFNGQEYKSTKYYGDAENQIKTNEPITGSSGDKVLDELVKADNSDARDDEIRRLEVISYSEVMNNELTKQAQLSLPKEYDANKQVSDSFMEKTHMHADTVTFPIRAERTTYDVTSYTYDGYTGLFTRDRRFEVNNIDFGIEFRPESNVRLNKFLSSIKLTTSDGKVLTDIEFKPVPDGKDSTRIIGTELDKDKSIGEENLQYLPSVISDPNETNKVVKGLAYLNVDEDLLQGCTVDITYIFNVTNESEVDTISQKLYSIRYKADAIEKYGDFLDDKNLSKYEEEIYKTYTASGTAKNELYKDYYEIVNPKIENQCKTCEILDRSKNSDIYRTKDKLSFNAQSDSGYYGKYLGKMYYTGEFNTSTDKVAELKVDKILDYVDTDMTFETSKNESEDRYWVAMTNEQLSKQKLLTENLFKEVNEIIPNKNKNQVETKQFFKLLDVKGIQFETDTKNNLAVSVDDRISAGDTENKNNLLSRFLTPYSSSLTKTGSSGRIYLVASQVLAGEKDTESMTYDNSAEIIQYTTLTGRITKLTTTIGNLDVTDPDYEDDSSFTERVTLTPPTGLEKTKYYLSIIKDKIIVTIIIVIAVIVILVIKKKLQKVNFKKFYK